MDARKTEGGNPVTPKADSVRDVWVALLAEIIVAAVREGQANG